ncbi:MAG: hypothetical protein R3C28_10670 [Pirellulaceae bacterium]
MNNAIRNRRLVAGSPLSLAILLLGAVGLCICCADLTWAQDDQTPILVEDVLADDADVSPDQTAQLSLLSLIIKGGYLMIPLGAMSILMVVVVVERYLALRTNRVLPKALLEGIANLNAVPGAAWILGEHTDFASNILPQQLRWCSPCCCELDVHNRRSKRW